MPTVEEIVKASEEGQVKYDIIEYRGVKLLITKSRLKPLIEITCELTHASGAEKLAEELGIKLRRFRD